MERLRKERGMCRTIFTKAKNNFEEKLQSADVSTDHISTAFNYLQGKAELLFDVDERIKRQWLELDDMADDEFFADCETAETYKYDWEQIKVLYENFVQKYSQQGHNNFETLSNITKLSVHNKSQESNHNCHSICSSSCHSIKKHFRLPKIELRKFDGNLKNWIGFWGQFKKIHNDDTMDNEDKFQFLFQSTVPDSPARELVESFPPSGDNYKKAIEQMKSRFAREDLLVEIYFRELLNLVLIKSKPNSGMSLSQLYDKIRTQLHALESLGVTTEKYASMLLPLVESALPEDILRIWERSRIVTDNTTANLNSILEFLRREVETEERIRIAHNESSSSDIFSSVNNHKPYTAASLQFSEANKNKEVKCIWCDKTSHTSHECFKANKISYEARKEILDKKGGCAICLKVGHLTKKCKNFTKCLVCTNRHSILMCPDIRNRQEKKEDKKKGHNITENPQILTSNKLGCTTLLQTLMVKISDVNNKYITIRALIDTGAQRSYINKELVQKLNLKIIDKETITNCLFGGVITGEEQYNVYSINISNISDNFNINLNVLDKNKICGYIPRMNKNHSLQLQLKKLNIVLSDVGDESIDIGLLIGADYCGSLLTNCFVQLDTNIVALKTKLGWTLQGPVHNIYSSLTTTVLSNLQIPELWELDAIGIKDPVENLTKAKEISDAHNYFKDTVVINKEGRYEVKLLWKIGHSILLNNKCLAEKRLLSTTKRLLQLNEFENYNNVFSEWLQDGIIEVDKQNNNMYEHFLPHHAVIKQSSQTTRIRPVFDGSARDYNGNSINSLLNKGDNYIELVPKLLLKFRKHAIGISADIKKAFLQISLTEKDRNYLKFIWWKNSERKELVTYRHCRVVFGLTCSPFLLAATILHHLQQSNIKFKRTSNILKESFYVDNCITSLETKEETNEFINEAKLIMSNAKFDLRSWTTSPIVNNFVCDTDTLSVLGVIWDIKNDELYCNVNINYENDFTITKRELLSVTQKIFDPLGICSPTTLVPKLLIQRTWCLKHKWDEKLPDDICKEFNTWFKDIFLLNKCRIPRRISKGSIYLSENSIHVFCDASKVSYAACIFLRSVYNNIVNVQLLQAKSRVAPMKVTSIPRLELLAALIATRLYIETKNALDLINCKVFFWTDSSVVLTWITTEKDWSVFVKNRVREIRQQTNISDWHHISGIFNPADLPSRGCNAKQLLESRWWEGPSWLKDKDVNWPKSEFKIDYDEVNKEKTKRSTINNYSNLTKPNFLSTITYFSKYTKIVRMVGWIIRFINNCKKDQINKGELTCKEY